MNKKTIYSLIVIIMVIGILFLVSKPKKELQVGGYHKTDGTYFENTENQTKETNGKLVALESFYDFGTISMKDGKVTKVFKVINGTDKDIFFPRLTTSCMCTAAFFVGLDGNKSGPFGMPGMGMVPKLDQTIKAGQSAEVEAVYDPNAHGPAGVGKIDRFIYLEDSNGDKLQFEIKAVVTP